MAIESKIKEIHPKEVEKKRTKMEEDALTNLPDSLQLHILSLLDTKYAVQTSALSKTFFSLWKFVPVLQFKSAAFRDLKAFDEFVDTVLRLGDHSHKLDTLIFNRQGLCNANILRKVLSYAFSSSVKKLEVFIQHSRNDTWPLYTCSDSLISLKLESDRSVNCPFLGPRSRSFKNLSVLYLKRALISDPEPFSGFPVLKQLTLLGCRLDKETDLDIRALQVTDLTISSYDECSDGVKTSSCKLTTPKLRFFDYRGPDFPPLQTHEGLPGLDTMVNFHGIHSRNDKWHLHTCSESLISLKLQSDRSDGVGCLLLGPRSGSFKNLSDLYLRLALMLDPEPFSGLPSLKKLTLLGCHPDKDTALSICAPQLTHLTIASYDEPCYVGKFSSCKLTTPKLRFFDYRGPDFPPLQTHDSLPGLDTMIIDFHGSFCPRKKDERRFEELLSLFSMVCNAKSLTLFASLVYFLASFHDELVNRDSPFNNLKCLKFDLRYSRHASQWYRVMPGKASKVRGYLLQNSPDAELIWAEDRS